MNGKILLVAVWCMLFVVSSCTGGPLSSMPLEEEDAGNASSAGTDLPRWPRSFGYQLQNVTMADLKNHPKDLYVVDIDDAQLTKDQIEDLHADGVKIVSYLSIGEAENYRGYWQKEWKPSSPAWLDEENPQWEGNFKVKYWDPQWQEIVYRQLDAIIEAGYDGAYLDVIDAYEYWAEKGEDQARQYMESFVISLSRYAKAKRPGFMIIPQNAPELAVGIYYLSAVDGFGKEDTWYRDDEEIHPEENQHDILNLDGAYANGKFVLAMDYPVSRLKKCDFIAKARSHWFVPTTGPRELDELWDEPAC